MIINSIDHFMTVYVLSVDLLDDFQVGKLPGHFGGKGMLMLGNPRRLRRPTWEMSWPRAWPGVERETGGAPRLRHKKNCRSWGGLAGVSGSGAAPGT